MSNSLIPVSFHGDSLFIIDHNDEPFTPMKPIVESIGLAWQVQHRKLTDNKERWGITILVIPSANGEQEMLCMPVRKLPAYLGNIYPNKVRPELRDKIILYQNECDDVLWKYWTGQQVKRQQAALESVTLLSTAADRAPLRSLVNAWCQASGLHQSALWPQVKAHFQLSSITDLPLDWIPDALAFVQGKIDECQQARQKALAAPQQAALTARPASPDYRTIGRQLRNRLMDLQTAYGDWMHEVQDVLVKRLPVKGEWDEHVNGEMRHCLGAMLHAVFHDIYNLARYIDVHTGVLDRVKE